MEQPNSEIIIYQNPDGNIKIDVRLEEETVWLTQAQMAMLFGKGRTTITEHIQNVFEEGELDEKVVCRNFRHTTASVIRERTGYGKNRNFRFFYQINYQSGKMKNHGVVKHKYPE